MRKYKTTTYEDRKSIENLYARGFPLAEIAATVGISVATLYRELSRGYTGNLKQWIFDLRTAGYAVEVCKGWESAAAVITEYLEGRYRPQYQP